MFKKKYFFFWREGFDWWIFFALIFFSFFSLLSLYSLSILGSLNSLIFYKQLFFFIFSFFIFFFFSNFNYKYWREYNRIIYILALFSLLLVLFFGKTINSTKGWFYIFGFGIQPVEFVKFSLVISLSAYLSNALYKRSYFRIFVESLFITLSLVFLILLQPDLGSALILLALWFAYLFISSIPWRYILFLIFSAVFLIVLAWNYFLAPYQKDRLMVFLNPSIDPLGAGYNIEQSMIAIGSGGFIGRGLGLGSQSQLRFIPERTTDFILAVLGEEFGFLGMSFILLLWLLIFYRIYRLFKKVDNNFAYNLLFGFILIFFLHIIVNLGMNLGIMPVIGISFPFLSQGGSFLFISFLFMGVIENISIQHK